MGVLESWFDNPDKSPVFCWISSFALGALFAPLSRGLLYVFVFMLILQLCTFYYDSSWNPGLQLTCVVMSFLGWVVGRYADKRSVGTWHETADLTT